MSDAIGRLPSHRLPLLVTGVTGVTGWNALDYFRGRYPGQVIGMRPDQPSPVSGPDIVAINNEDREAVRGLVAHYRFGSILNCAGNCALKSCELDVGMARRLNVDSADVIAEAARARGSRLVHLSSDLVFGGREDGQYVESDPVSPVTVYGKTMAEGEAAVSAGCHGSAILRISLPMGPSPNRHAGAIDWIESRFRNSRPATLYFDEVRSCTYVADLNRVFEWMLLGDEAGLFHAGGPRGMTLYQIGQVVNRIGGFAPELLHGCPRRDAGPMPPRAGDVSMCSDKLVSLMGRQPFRAWPARDDHVPTDRRWHYAEDGQGRGSHRHLEEHLYQHPADPYRVPKAPH
jgi:dTDP-4-dehydrorhamnose reductase